MRNDERGFVTTMMRNGTPLVCRSPNIYYLQAQEELGDNAQGVEEEPTVELMEPVAVPVLNSDKELEISLNAIF